MSSRTVAFINPFGTDLYDRIIADTLEPVAMDGTELVIRNLTGAPKNIDYFWPKHLLEVAVFKECLRLEADGVDAIIVGCCYDPGVRVARELVDVPVVGPLEASLNMASYFGHRATVVTDHHKAVPYIEDLVRLYGQQNVRNVRCIDWWVTEMVEAPGQVAADAAREATRAMEEDAADVVVLGCTIIAACFTQHLRDTGEFREVAIMNPNVMALKSAEMLADLQQRGEYRLSRRGYYERQTSRSPEEFEDLKRLYTSRSTPSSAD